jgi:hypothetical protein
VGAAQDLSPGARFGRYRIEGHVASGGMGVVYRATDLELDRRVALKLIAPEWAGDADLRERFKHESRLVAALDHPNVIPVHDAGERDGLLYIAMRFVDGTDLRGLIDERGALDARLAARVTARIASALDAAHAAGLVHRDVKPANVLLAGEPGEEHPYLTDFGLAKRLDGDSGLTHSGQWLGTVDYVAPEQLSGKPVDHRTDIYSLAVLLFEALTGEVPFPGDSAPAKMTAKLHEPPPSVCERAPWLPAALEDVLKRGMAPDPDERYQSAGALGRALLAAAGESPAPVPKPRPEPADAAPPPPTTPAGGHDHEDVPPPRDPVPAPEPRRARPVVWIALGVLAIAVVVAGLTVGGVLSSTTGAGSNAPQRTVDTPPGAPSAASADAVVRRFGDAYRAEDLDTLMATLTGDVQFNFEGGGTKTAKQGTAVLRKEFATQFALTDDYRLRLTGRDRTTGGRVVLGRFSENVLSNTRTSGTVSFEVVFSGGRPLIRTISSKVDQR